MFVGSKTQKKTQPACAYAVDIKKYISKQLHLTIEECDRSFRFTIIMTGVIFILPLFSALMSSMYAFKLRFYVSDIRIQFSKMKYCAPV